MQQSQTTYGHLSLDQRAYLFFPNKKEEKSQQGKKGTRFFYYGQIEHDQYQRKKMNEFYQYIAKNKLNYDRQFFDQQMLLLFLQGNGYKPKETIQALNSHLQFRKTYLPVDFSKVEKLIKNGFFYPCGRDKNFRPILVFNATLFNVKDIQTATLATIFVHQEIIKSMFIPGQVQNWTIIYDLGGMGVTDIPMSAIKGTTAKMSHNYGGRLFKMFITNAPGTIYFSWKVVSAFLDPVTVQKIKISKNNSQKTMFDNIDPSQVQQKYGGHQPNRTQYWPFQIPSGVFDEKRLVTLDQYENRLKTGFLKRNTIHPKFCQKKQGPKLQDRKE